MYLALFSVAFGSALTFAQAAALFHLLELDTYVAYRAVLNTMNVAAPFLCLGFDSSAPVLRRMNPDFPFFWNLLVLHTLAFLVLVALSITLPAASKLQPLTLGLAASTSVAAALTVANYHRTEGAIRRYFLSINVVDKTVRTAIIIGLAAVVHEVVPWAVLVATVSFAYVGLTSTRTGTRPQHFRTSFPYIFSSLGIIALTRMPFYAAYLVEEKIATAKVDIWLLFTLFLLIPVLNKSKIEEASSTGLAQRYLTAMKGSWRALLKQELLISTGIVAAACGAVLVGKAAPADLLVIVLPLMIGMILIASIPNYVQILCFTGQYSLGVKTSVLITLIALVAYLPQHVVGKAPTAFFFVGSALLYCGIGCGVARLLGTPIADFWRWRGALAIIGFSATALIVAHAVLGHVA